MQKKDDTYIRDVSEDLTVLDENGPVDSIPLTRAETVSGQDLESDDLLELLSGVRIRSIIRDSNNRLWIAAWRKIGLLRYDQGEVLAFTPDDGLFSDRIRVVCERGDGSVMVANTGGVSLIKDDHALSGIQGTGCRALIVRYEWLRVVVRLFYVRILFVCVTVV